MKSINPQDLSIRDRHRLMTSAINPRPICWASTINNNGNPNLAPYSFFNMFSANPPILVFSSNRRGKDNTTKDTLHNIEATKEVVINVVPYELVNQMNICSTDYPSEVNEFIKAGLTPIESELVKPFRVKESPVQFECKVNDIIKLGNEGGAGNLFLCEVVRIHYNESKMNDNGTFNPHKLDLVGRLGSNDYVRAKGDAVFEINNPFEKMNLGFDKLPEHILTSRILTGNDIASVAMETDFPSEKDKEQVANLVKGIKLLHKDKIRQRDELHEQARLEIRNGNIKQGFSILMSYEA